jgi:hypothetical protein
MEDQQAKGAVMAGNTSTSYRVVLGAGLATTALVLFGVHVLNQVTDDFQVMGFYVEYVIPLGALIVGLLAAVGYGAASWLAGVRMSKWLIWAVVLLQVGAYFAAQYIEFRSLDLVYENGEPVGFLEYFDHVTRQFAWVEDGKAGEPFGMWGYAMRALEIGGFAFGGLIVPLILLGRPYCEACSAYYRRKRLALLPAGVAPKKIRKRDAEARKEYEASDERAREQGLAALQQLFAEVAQGNAEGGKALLAEHEGNQKAIGKLTGRISLDAYWCRRCDGGFLRATLLAGQGDKVATSHLGDSARMPDVSPLG